MAVKVKSVDRRELLDRITVAVEKAARNGGTLRLDETVRTLQGDDAPSMPLLELEREIVRVALHAGVGVDFSPG